MSVNVPLPRQVIMPLLLSAGVAVSFSAIADSLTPKEQLGKSLFFDKISSPDWVSCATCHDPDVGWTGAVVGINKHGSVYRGAVPTRFGNRKPPSSAYATFSPVFYFDPVEELFVGGNFWDGRATGEKLGNPAADQALGPFLNPVEQNNPSREAVCQQVADSQYAYLFEQVWGPGSLDCSITGIEGTYDRIGLSIASYEASSEVNQFSSKFDAYLAGNAELTEQEAWGLELFEGKAMCSACHITEPGPIGEPPLLTDFTYDNIGVPPNPDNPFYVMDEEYLDDGSPINPEGVNWVDPGLGGFLQRRPEWADKAAENLGKHKVPTLRNVGKGFGGSATKAFTHNGYFKSLKSVVNFYNTRDVKPVCPDPFTVESEALKQGCWPAPEVQDNVNTDELGDLGLTPEEEDAIVAFMETLSDGFKVKKNTNKRPH
jgi:cytochrome c peroxidase